jgi:hypothetical protein
VGDRMDTAYGGGRMCVKEPAVDLALYHRACLSAGGPGAAEVPDMPHGLNGAVLATGDEEARVCHMGRSTILHFSGTLPSDHCAALEAVTANYTYGSISCASGAYEGYFHPASTLRFQGQGSLGVVGTWVVTKGPQAGYQGSAVWVLSMHDDGVVKGVMLTKMLDAVHGGILYSWMSEYTLVVTLDDAGVPLQQPCDASKTRGFTPLERSCDPDEAWGYVNPWAPDASTMPASETPPVSAPSTPDKVLKCGSAAVGLGGASPDVDIDYHCIYKDAHTNRRTVSGTMGKYGYFQGEFVAADEAYANLFAVMSSSAGGAAVPVSGAVILKYDVGADNMPVALVTGQRWFTGTSSNAEGVGTWSSNGYGCVEETDAAVVVRHCLAPVQGVREDWAGTCQDAPGFMDSLGRTCHEWSQHPAWCMGTPEDGNYDPPSVYANSDGVDASQACCVCKQASLPFAGTLWIRKGPDELHHEEEEMGEVSFCSQAVNVVAPHSFRELSPACTKRMVDEKRCPLTPFDNRTLRSDSLVFAGSVPGALGVVGVYAGAEEAGHLLLVLTSPHTLRGFSCSHTHDGNVTRCKDLAFSLYQADRKCENTGWVGSGAGERREGAKAFLGACYADSGDGSRGYGLGTRVSGRGPRVWVGSRGLVPEPWGEG